MCIFIYFQAVTLELDNDIAFFFSIVWEVRFHPTNPDHLFTCSEDGSLLHWETSSGSDAPLFLQGERNLSVMFSWASKLQ